MFIFRLLDMKIIKFIKEIAKEVLLDFFKELVINEYLRNWYLLLLEYVRELIAVI